MQVNIQPNQQFHHIWWCIMQWSLSSLSTHRKRGLHADGAYPHPDNTSGAAHKSGAINSHRRKKPDSIYPYSTIHEMPLLVSNGEAIDSMEQQQCSAGRGRNPPDRLTTSVTLAGVGAMLSGPITAQDGGMLPSRKCPT